MIKQFFYNLDIDKDVECGWQDVLNDAKVNCPEGTALEFDDGYKGFYHPCGCYERSRDLYNKYKAEMQNIIDTEGITLKNINYLFKIDVFLYHILSGYVSDFEYMDCSCYNPNNIPESMEDMKDYCFSEYFELPILDEYKMFKGKYIYE